jgi:hypothetical protein
MHLINSAEVQDVEIIVDYLIKIVLTFSAAAGVLTLVRAISSASSWAGSIQTEITQGFARNNSDHGVLKDLLDEHTKLIATHGIRLSDHKARLVGLEREVYKAKVQSIITEEEEV